MARSRAVFFDLDGTLADTAPDLGMALNRLLEEEGRPPRPAATLRPHVSAGSRGLLAIGFGLTPADAAYPDLQRRVPRPILLARAVVAARACRQAGD